MLQVNDPSALPPAQWFCNPLCLLANYILATCACRRPLLMLNSRRRPQTRQIKRMIASYVGENDTFEKQYAFLLRRALPLTPSPCTSEASSKSSSRPRAHWQSACVPAARAYPPSSHPLARSLRTPHAAACSRCCRRQHHHRTRWLSNQAQRGRQRCDHCPTARVSRVQRSQVRVYLHHQRALT